MARFFLLLALRLKLTVRYYTGNRGRLIGLVIGILIFVPIAAIATLAANSFFGTLAEHERRKFFDFVLLSGAIFLVTGPLMGFRANEFLDVTKLFLFPLRPAVVFSAAVVGSWLNGINIFFVPLLVVPAVAYAPSTEEAVIRVGVVLLFLFHLFALTQCLNLALLNVLRSRRFSDLMAILAPVFGLTMYLGLRLLMPDAGSRPDVRTMLDAVPFDQLRPFLPPLWAGTGILGSGVPRLAWVAALLVLTAAIVAVSLVLTRKAFYGEVALVVGTTRAREKAGLLRRMVLRMTAPETGAVYEKELLTLRREPWFKTLFIQQLGFVVLIVVIQAVVPGARRNPGSTQTTLWVAGLALFYVEMNFLSNILMLEGQGILHLATLPARRFQILLGKNIAHFQVVFLINSVLLPLVGATIAWLHPARHYPTETVLLLVAVNLATLPVVIGMGNISSVYFPIGIGARGKRVLSQETQGGDGCITALYRSVLWTAAMVPVGIIGFIVAIPSFDVVPALNRPIFYAVTVPVGIVLGLAVYALLLVVSSRALMRREPQILEELLKGGK